MSADLHSVRVPPALAAVDAVIAILPNADPRQPLRHDLADELVEHVHEFVRDHGDTVVTFRVEGLTRVEWDEVGGVHVNGWKKRVERRDLAGALVAAIEYETDQDWEGR